MKRRKTFVITIILLMILSLSGVAGTLIYSNQSHQIQGGQPPMIDNNQSTPQDSNNATPPSLPGGNNQNSNENNTPPDGNNTSNQTNIPSQSGDNNSQDSQNTPPSLPSENNSQDNQNSSQSTNDNSTSQLNTPPDMPDSNQGLDIVQMIIIDSCLFIFTASGLLVIVTGAGKKKIGDSLNSGVKKTVYVVSTIALTTALSFGTVYGSRQLLQQDHIPQMSESSQVDATGAITVTDTQTLSSTYSSTNNDESAILVNGGNATITNATVTKTGDTSNTENSEFYGVNAGILVQKDSTATISNTKITTDAKGANAVFSTGENSKITIKDSTINTSSSSSRGLDATYGGTIEADNVTITTQGQSCATLATDRGEGTVSAKNSTLETNGQGSPIIYSTGNISIDNTTGTSNGSQMVVIEGKNSATVTNSTLTSSAKGNRNDVDNCGIMIYQSMSGDASEGTGTFTSTNSSLSINKSSSYYKTAPMFFITNTDAVINLTNTKLSYGSNTLLSIKGTSEWGNSGNNGGNVTFNTNKQTLKGNIEVDNISTLTLVLKSSTYTGTINSANTAKSISISLDKNSTWNVTGDSYITTLTIENNDTSLIKSNGHTIYYNSSENSWLNNKTITLSDGGKLVPIS